MTITLTFSSVEEYRTFLTEVASSLDVNSANEALRACECKLAESELKIKELEEQSQTLQCRYNYLSDRCNYLLDSEKKESDSSS